MREQTNIFHVFYYLLQTRLLYLIASEITRLRGPIYEDKIVELVKSKAKVIVKEVNKKELEQLVKDLSSNLKSKSSTKSAKISNDKSKKDTKSEDKSKSIKKISKK